MVDEDYDHVNEDVNDGLMKKDDDVTKSIVGLKLEQSKNSHDYMKMTNMKMKGKRLKSRRSQREVRIDDCEYSGAYDKCGDKFLSIFSDCKCGYEILRASFQYCCLSPSDPCTGDGDGDVDCPTGKVKNMTESCDGVCYNSYQHSQQIGPNAQYSYDGGDKCVPVEDICQGISYCQEDVEICNEKLKCIKDFQFTFKVEKLNIVGEHHYCYNEDQYKNNGKFDIIDRSDEQNINIATVKNISYTAFTQCNDSFNNLGVMCEDECLRSAGWCTDDDVVGYDGVGSTGQVCHNISSTDDQLCSNYTFWSNVSCTVYNTD